MSLCLHDGPCFRAADAWEIVDIVAAHYGLTRQVLLSPRRTAPIARARHMAMYLLREQGMTYAQIGRFLRRDHSTALYGYSRIQTSSLREPAVRRDLTMLRRQTHAA